MQRREYRERGFVQSSVVKMDMHEIEQLLTRKLDMLCLEREDTLHILRNGNVNEVENQAKYYKKSLDEIKELQRDAKKAKLDEGVTLAGIKEWNKEVVTERKKVISIRTEFEI